MQEPCGLGRGSLFFCQAEDGIRDYKVTGVQTCALPISDLNISSAMGIILLVGLVVKNGIMLLDFSEKLHAEGEPFETAIAHAGRIRLRPILMTTFCTLFGLLPLALGLGAGAELQKPLALAVIGGLALSTPVTLLIVPGLYAAIKARR